MNTFSTPQCRRFVHCRAAKTKGTSSLSAVIAGGSISGLLAAHVLGPYVDSITIVDQDDISRAPRTQNVVLGEMHCWRKGVPHIDQPHQLTAGGVMALEHLFPGFVESVVQHGGMPLDLCKEVYYFDHKGKYPNFASNLQGLGVSRPLLEQCIRDRVFTLWGHKLSFEKSKVNDMKFQHNSVQSATLEGGKSIECDLFIDAMGRSSTMPKILQQHGYPEPELIFVDAKVKSASQIVRMPKRRPEDWKLLVIKDLPDGRTGGSLLPMENGYWQVTLAEVGGSFVPLNNQEFLEFSKRLPDNSLFNILRQCEPVTNVKRYHALRNERLQYVAKDVPYGLLPIGDSVQRLNPIYGQGITVCAQSAIVLAKVLEASCHQQENMLQDLTQKYILKLMTSLQKSWKMAIASDLRYQDVVCKGHMQKISKYDQMLADRLLKRAQNDPKLYQRLLQIAHLVTAADDLKRDPYIFLTLMQDIISRY